MKNNYLQDLFSLEGKVALVTGGGRGIGQVICRELARCGADIAIFSRSGAGETVKLIESEGGKALDIIADATDESSVRKGMEKIMDDLILLSIMQVSATIKTLLRQLLKNGENVWTLTLPVNISYAAKQLVL